MSESRFRSLVQDASERIISFAQRAVQTPSPSGREGEMAALVAQEMRALAFDEVTVDRAGNVIGRLAGGPGRRVLLHAHMDTVSPADPGHWSRPPYAGDLAGGYIWGRGAADTKGSLVAQVYALGLLKEAGLMPPGDIYQASVVCEEIGGLGTLHMLEHLVPDVAIIGEPSGNTLRRGHRGRYEWVLTLQGRPAHASAPERGINPHYSMARFLLALRAAELPKDTVFGGSSAVPTLSYVSSQDSNVIPEEITTHLDWRAIPGDTHETSYALLQNVLAASLEEGIKSDLRLRRHRVRTYTGYERELTFELGGYCLDIEAPDLLSSEAGLRLALGRDVPVGVWTFSTDGGYLAAKGIPCIGFGPGEESMAHTYDERLAVDQLLEATAAYMALAMTLARRD